MVESWVEFIETTALFARLFCSRLYRHPFGLTMVDNKISRSIRMVESIWFRLGREVYRMILNSIPTPARRKGCGAPVRGTGPDRAVSPKNH
jgi:hypothetical protein